MIAGGKDGLVDEDVLYGSAVKVTDQTVLEDAGDILALYARNGVALSVNGAFKVVVVVVGEDSAAADMGGVGSIKLGYRAYRHPIVRTQIDVIHQFGGGVWVLFRFILIVVASRASITVLESIQTIDVGREPSQAFCAVDFPMQRIIVAVGVIIWVGDFVMVLEISVSTHVRPSFRVGEDGGMGPAAP